MVIPKKVKVGKKWYIVEQRQKAAHYGATYYKIGRIMVVTGEITGVKKQLSQEAISDTFWHELTHAILYDMEHPLKNNEKFVTGFSNRLNTAILSAKF